MDQKMLEKQIPTIKNYARVCLKKVNKPTLYEEEDLTDEGVLVLCNASERFDPSLNIPFDAYFKTCLKIHFAGIVATSYNKIPAKNQSNDKQRNKKSADTLQTSVVFENLKKLTQNQLQLLLFFLKPPDFIINEFIEHPKRQITNIRKLLDVSEYKERKLRREMLQALLA